MISLTVPSEPSALAVIRATAGAIAARASLTLDQIDDVRMAVEEAGVVLLAAGVPISMTADPTSAPFRIEVSVQSVDGVEMGQDTLAWVILQGMTEHVDLQQSSGQTTVVMQFQQVATAR